MAQKIDSKKSNEIREELDNNLYEILDELNHAGFNVISTEWETKGFKERFGSWTFFNGLLGEKGYTWSKKDKQFIEIKNEFIKENKNQMIEDSQKAFFLDKSDYNYVYKTITLDEKAYNRYCELINGSKQPKALINTKMFEKFCDWLES